MVWQCGCPAGPTPASPHHLICCSSPLAPHNAIATTLNNQTLLKTNKEMLSFSIVDNIIPFSIDIQVLVLQCCMALKSSIDLHMVEFISMHLTFISIVGFCSGFS